MRRTKILAGSSHGELSKLITERLGMRPANVNVKQFANHETALEIDVSVRGEDVFLIQSGGDNINDYLMELLIMANACKMASARRITAIIPYFPYSKQSKKKKMRGCITAKLIADMLQVAGVQHVITMDLHSSQIGGFFHISTLDNLFAEPSFARFIKEKIPDYTNGVVVSKNAGGAKRVTMFADRLKIDFALIHKYNTSKDCPTAAETERDPSQKPQYASLSAISSVDSLVSQFNADTPLRMSTGSRAAGNGAAVENSAEDSEDETSSIGDEDVSRPAVTLVGDVRGKVAFIVDDMIDSANSFTDAARHLIKNQAKRVYIVATHAILSGNALAAIETCEYVCGIIVTNTYPIPEWKRAQTKKLTIIDISGVLAEAIRRTHNGESISYLFDAAIP